MSDASKNTIEEAPLHGGDEKPLANVPEDSVPLRQSLGPYGDISAACTVLRVEIDKAAKRAVDARYVLVNEEYERICSRSAERLVGRSYLEVAEVDPDEWLAQCYRVVVGGETVSGFEYNPLVRDWISFNLAPSDIAGCCIYTFMVVPINVQQHRQLVTSTDARTSGFISEVLGAFSVEQDYETAMNGVLEKTSQVIHAERLMIFECGKTETRITAELCSEGVEPQLGTVFKMPREAAGRWFEHGVRDAVALVPDVSVIERFSEPLYLWCRKSGVTNILAAPFYSDGEFVGFLGAYNYQLDETVDLNRLFSMISSFVGARIEIRRLIENLEWAGDHDVMTDVLNRRGSQIARGKLFSECPEGPFTLILLDIDDFKRINDIYGHNAGDEALRMLASTLTEVFANDAVVARNGGDEFLVLLSGEAALQVDELVSDLMEKDLGFEYEGGWRSVTISVGYACYPEQADDRRDLFAKADDALYAVKIAGKSGFGKYRPEVETIRRFQLGFSARDVIDNVPWPMIVNRGEGDFEALLSSAAFAKLLEFDDMYDMMRTCRGRLEDLVYPYDRECPRENMERCIAQGNSAQPVTFDCRYITKSGGVKKLNITSHLVHIADIGPVFYSIAKPCS